MEKSNTANAKSAAGYAVRLAFAREHSQALPLVAPANLVPKTVLTNVSAWADGMHTYCYTLNDKVAAKHVFTSNRDNLQKEANFLFRAIQEHVELRREIKGPGTLTLWLYLLVNCVIIMPQVISHTLSEWGVVVTHVRWSGEMHQVVCTKGAI
jgi:hypothetical protein